VKCAVISVSTGKSLLAILFSGDLPATDRWRENCQSNAAGCETANAIDVSQCAGSIASKQFIWCDPLSAGLLPDPNGWIPACQLSVQLESSCWFDDHMDKTNGCFCTRQAMEFDWRYTSGDAQSKVVAVCFLCVASVSLGDRDVPFQSMSLEQEWFLAVVAAVHGGKLGGTGLRRGTMNKDSDDEKHPLDQDYSQVVEPKRRLVQLPEGNVLRVGVICFLVGLFSAVLTAALLGVFQGVRSLETVGSYVHQIAMVMILFGGVLMLLGFRLGRIKTKGSRRFQRWVQTWRSLLLLLAVNVIIGLVVPTLVDLLEDWFPPRLAAFILHLGMMLVTVIAAMGCLLHRGWWRGFCVGVLVASVAAYFHALNSVGISLGMYGSNRFGYGRALAESFWMMQCSGMMGASYAKIFDMKKSNAKADAVDESVDPV